MSRRCRTLIQNSHCVSVAYLMPRQKMGKLLELYVIFGIFAVCHGSESPKEIETFIESVIETWQLRSPTILVLSILPKLCMSKNHAWVLCLLKDQNSNELMNHLVDIHQHTKQDGLIFVGELGHETILKNLSEKLPHIFTSNCPVFMPASYESIIQLRLDSNILFYKSEYTFNATYVLHDIFAVKAGPSNALEVGQWKFDSGMSLIKSLNRCRWKCKLW